MAFIHTWLEKGKLPSDSLKYLCFVNIIADIAIKLHLIFAFFLKNYSPEEMGLLDPSTSDGRVIFFLPWQKLTIAGTTDSPCKVTHNPAPSEKDIQFILGEVKNYLSPDLEGNFIVHEFLLNSRFAVLKDFR